MKAKQIISIILLVMMLVAIAVPLTAFADDEIVIEEETIDEGILVNDIEEKPEYVVPDEDVYIDESENAEEVVSADEDDSILVDETSPTDTAEDVAEAEDISVDQLTDIDTVVFEAGSAIKITEQPKDIVGAPGENATLKVVATGNGLSYQWQYKVAGASKYTNAVSAGAKTAEWTITLKDSIDGRTYRCVITDANGNKVISNPVTITVSKEIVVDGVTYEPIDSTTCRVKSYKGTAASLTIPETVQGMTVTEIGEEAFMGNTALTSIKLPATITTIRARAFKNCTSLKEMN